MTKNSRDVNFWRQNPFFWLHKTQGEGRVFGLNLCWWAGSSPWLHLRLGWASHPTHRTACSSFQGSLTFSMIQISPWDNWEGEAHPHHVMLLFFFMTPPPMASPSSDQIQAWPSNLPFLSSSFYAAEGEQDTGSIFKFSLWFNSNRIWAPPGPHSAWSQFKETIPKWSRPSHVNHRKQGLRHMLALYRVWALDGDGALKTGEVQSQVGLT